MIVCDLFALAVIFNCQIRFASPYLKTGTTQKKLDFVEVIKQDLRRNNDDYKEIRDKIEYKNKNSSAVLNKIKNETNTVKNRRKFRRNDVIYQDDDYDDAIQPFTEEINKNTTQITTPLTPKITPKINLVNVKITQNETKQSLPFKNINNNIFSPIVPKFVKKNKINKYRQFMKNNEGLLRNYMSSKQTQTHGPKLLESSKVVRHFKPNVLKQGVIDKIKKVQKADENNNDALPNPELLDMAPAKGGRIHRKRIKGRLCHRHVLIPEGPKYDSSGRWYLPAHELIARRPYNVTRRPRLILPRCCNCCKKSLLGCE